MYHKRRNMSFLPHPKKHFNDGATNLKVIVTK